MPEQFVRPKFPVTAAVEDFMWNRTSEHTAANKTTSSTLNVTANSILQNVTGNVSAVEGCYLLNFEEMEFLPWDNLDNIVSAEVENIARRLKDGVFLPILFVIGAPANVINMAVFYKQGLKERVILCLFALSLADELYLIQAMFVFGIDQLQQQFASKAGFGPMTRFMINNNLIGFFGFTFTSQVLSAIIASDRCFCVLSPLRFQNLLRTRTMAIIVFVVYLVVMSLYFLISTRYRIVCVFDPVSDTVRYTVEASQFYRKHRLIFYVDSFVFGAGIPVVVIVVVTAATIITAMKIRQAALWRERDLFSKQQVIVVDLSPRGGADKDVDRQLGAVHCVRLSHGPVALLLALSVGDERRTSQPQLLPDQSMDQGDILFLKLHLQHLCVLHHGLSLQSDVLRIIRKRETGQS